MTGGAPHWQPVAPNERFPTEIVARERQPSGEIWLAANANAAQGWPRARLPQKSFRPRPAAAIPDWLNCLSHESCNQRGRVRPVRQSLFSTRAKICTGGAAFWKSSSPMPLVCSFHHAEITSAPRRLSANWLDAVSRKTGLPQATAWVSREPAWRNPPSLGNQ